MNAWPDGDVMGPTATRVETPKAPKTESSNDLSESRYLIAIGSRIARFRRKNKNKTLVIVLLVLLLFLLCLAVAMTVLYIKQKRYEPINICESKECIRSAANLMLSIDKTADPCQDFYQYACGNWATDHPRPDAYWSYDLFRDKQNKVYNLLRDLLTMNTRNQPGPVQQAKDVYTACMDTKTLDNLGLKPVLEILKKLTLPNVPTFINATENFDYSNYNFDWIEAVIKIKTLIGMDVLIGFDIYTDPKNSSIYRLVMESPETINPFPSTHNEKKRHARRIIRTGETKFEKYKYLLKNRDYFENNNQKKHNIEEISQIYKTFYAALIKAFTVEAEIAKDSKLSKAELEQNILMAAAEYYKTYDDIYELEPSDTESDEDLDANTPEYTVDQIQSHTDTVVKSKNGIAVPIWKRYLEGVFNISKVTLNFEKDKILISESNLKYMSLMASFISKAPPVTIELYIWVRVVKVMSVHTTSEMRTLFQHLYEEFPTKYGEISRPRGLYCASAVNEMLGMAVSYTFANPHFFDVTKPKIETMIDELKNALAHLISQTKWMDYDTKLATYQKIIEMKTHIGFPDWLLKINKLEQYYEGILVHPRKHLENFISIVQVKLKKALNRFREGNNFDWTIDPSEVNAYHTFEENTIILKPYAYHEVKFDFDNVSSLDVLDAAVPLVLLQYPFFNLGLDSLNYGSLGTVLGHEIMHGFDNYGRQFDKNGNRRSWWANKTITSFVNMTRCFIRQYSSFYLTEISEFVDGKRTLDENIADNVGLREALVALKNHLMKHGPEPKLPGFEHLSSEQLFFLSYGNLWCDVTTKASLLVDLEDEHAPRRFRAHGSLQNTEEFAQAWMCPRRSRMVPRKRCILF